MPECFKTFAYHLGFLVLRSAAIQWRHILRIRPSTSLANASQSYCAFSRATASRARVIITGANAKLLCTFLSCSKKPAQSPKASLSRRGPYLGILFGFVKKPFRSCSRSAWHASLARGLRIGAQVPVMRGTTKLRS
jgi:hypothetical protein